MKLMRKPLSRRTLLRGAGGACIALPLLEAMAPQRATAQPTATRRLITLYTPNGQIQDRFYPTGSENDWELSEILEPLAAHKHRLITFDDNIRNDAANDETKGGHQGSHAAMISGFGPSNSHSHDAMRPGGPSLDQVVADKIGGDTKFKSLQTGVLSGTDKNPFVTIGSWRSEQELLPPQEEPARVFDFLFKDAAEVGNSGSAEQIRLRRQSVLDGIIGRYERLNSSLGIEDRARLEIHLSSIRELERQVVTDAQISCATPDKPVADYDRSGDNLDAYGRVQSDLMASALACGLTNVASFLWLGMGSAHTTFSNLGHNTNNHALAHSRDVSRLVECNRFFAEQVSYLMDRLEEYPDVGGSSLLDNTLILWWNELGTGNSHNSDPAPFVLAGGAGDALEMGRFIRFSDSQQSNDMLLTVHNAVTGADDTVFGDPKYSNGPLPGV